jgi:hypothetical protein
MFGPANCHLDERPACAGKTFSGVAPIGKGYMDSKTDESKRDDVVRSPTTFARSASLAQAMRLTNTQSSLEDTDHAQQKHH